MKDWKDEARALSINCDHVDAADPDMPLSACDSCIAAALSAAEAHGVETERQRRITADEKFNGALIEKARSAAYEQGVEAERLAMIDEFGKWINEQYEGSLDEKLYVLTNFMQAMKRTGALKSAAKEKKEDPGSPGSKCESGKARE